VTGFLAGLRIPHSDCSLKSVVLLGRIYYGVKNSVFGSVPMLDRLLGAILETYRVLCLPDDSQPRTAAENVSGANNGTRLGRKTNSAAILESAGKKRARTPGAPLRVVWHSDQSFVSGQGFLQIRPCSLVGVAVGLGPLIALEGVGPPGREGDIVDIGVGDVGVPLQERPRGEGGPEAVDQGGGRRLGGGRGQTGNYWPERRRRHKSPNLLCLLLSGWRPVPIPRGSGSASPRLRTLGDGQQVQGNGSHSRLGAAEEDVQQLPLRDAAADVPSPAPHRR